MKQLLTLACNINQTFFLFFQHSRTFNKHLSYRIVIDKKSINNNPNPKQKMQVIELKPSNRIQFKIPNTLTSKFTIGNLTLRTVCIFAVPLHPHFISVDNKAVLIDAFQQADICVTLHWSQAMNTMMRTKLRIYIWELYDDEGLGTVVAKMFDKETDGNCLLFEEITIDVQVDNKYAQITNTQLPHSYLIERINLPNQNSVAVTQAMSHRVLNHCQKLGKIKAIYTHGQRYVVEFSHVEDFISSFCQVRDTSDRLAIFGIGCIVSLGHSYCSPDLLYLNCGKSEVKPHVRKENLKDQESKKYIQQAKPSNKKIKIEQKEKQKEKQKELQQQDQKQKNISTKQFQAVQKDSQAFIDQETKPQHIASAINPPTNPKTKPRDITKQSFFIAPESRGAIRKRTKSQQIIKDEQGQFSSTSIDIEVLNNWRNASNFQIKSKKIYEQKSIDVSKRILNMQISSDQKYLYLLMRDCIMICDVDFCNKRIIKFDPIDTENINLPTPMLLLNKQRTIIFANQSYLFWVSLIREEEPDWKYVQRKQIYAIQVIEQLNLLMVGGKNFSKLAYLGKSTSRSNIKVYSSGKTGKREHLFTYDIPNCNGQNVVQMKHITTKPNGTKLLTVLTHLNKLFFLRVRAFNHIEVFSCIETTEIGIQEIVSMKYYDDSSILVCLEKLSEQALCFKYIKVNCSYEKVQMSTQSLKMPVVKYSPNFRIGGRAGNQWLSAIDQKYCIYSFYLEWKQPEKSQYKNPIKDCLILKRGAIFREATQVKCRIIKE